jgi:hypothetical protein
MVDIMPDPLQFKMTSDGYCHAITHDDVDITRVLSGNNTVVYYKYSRPDIDKQRVRLHYEELVKYGLIDNFGIRKPFSLDQHRNMHWGKETLPYQSQDKDGFPLYPQKSDEMVGPGVADGGADGRTVKGFKSIIIPDWIDRNHN